MITFFRKLRQKLITQNRVSKYLMYALGEIILVVIGILIALQINNWNERQAQEEKIANTLRQIQAELLNDIVEAKTISDLYDKKITMIDEFINQKQPMAYFDKNIHEFISLTFGFIGMTISDQSFTRLKAQIDILPEKYNGLLPHLNQLYMENGALYRKSQKVSTDVFFDYKNKIYNQYNWIEDYSASRYTTAIKDFFLKSDTNRRQLIKMQQVLKNDRALLRLILDQSVQCYIYSKDSLNDSSPLPESMMALGLAYQQNILQDLPGTYAYKGKLFHTISYQNQMLLLTLPQQTGVYYKSLALTELAKDSLGLLLNANKLKIQRDSLGKILGYDFYISGRTQPLRLTKQ